MGGVSAPGEMSAAMSNARSSVDMLQARARPGSALDQINESLAALEERLRRGMRPEPAHEGAGDGIRFERDLARLESRVCALAGQVGEIVHERPPQDLVERVNMLSRRFDELAQNSMPREAMERLAGQIALMAARLGEAPVPSDIGHLMEDLEKRFDLFTVVMERRQNDALEQGNSIFRDLGGRLDEISERLDGSEKGLGAMDQGLIRSLEAQMADLSAHLARRGLTLPDMEDIGPRLSQIELVLGKTRETIVEAARKAAERAVKSMAGHGMEQAAVAGLARDLKELEELTRRSDDRNARTFEAIHDTLLKIVERLGTLEETAGATAAVPPAQNAAGRTHGRDMETAAALADGKMLLQDGLDDEADADIPAAAISAEANIDAEEPGGRSARRRSLLGGLARAFRKDTAAARSDGSPSFAEGFDADLADALDSPPASRQAGTSSGVADLGAILKRVRAEPDLADAGTAQGPASDMGSHSVKADFIAAARRAARVAAAEAEMLKRQPSLDEPAGSRRIGDVLKASGRPILMAIGAVVLVLAGLELSKATRSGGPPAVAVEAGAQSSSTPKGPRALVKTVPAARHEAAPAGRTSAAHPASAPAPAGAILPNVVLPADMGTPALREAVAAGDARALFEIGARYAEGRGVPQDVAAAAGWYEMAAEKGLAPAQYRIGNLLEKGAGVERDAGKARIWYEKAARQGNAGAMHNLAVLLAMGSAGPVDNEGAARWFKAAADLGVSDSQFNLAILAAKGLGMAQNLEASYKWFALAARSGDEDAAGKRDEIAGALRPEQLEWARQTAELWVARELDAEANGVVIPDAWLDAPVAMASLDTKQAVASIQRILNSNGYPAGTIDGVMGGKTKEAIIAFQTANGLSPTGEVDERLVEVLGARK